MTDSQKEKISAYTQAIIFVLVLGVKLAHKHESVFGVMDAIVTAYASTLLVLIPSALWAGIKAGLKEWNDPKYTKK